MDKVVSKEPFLVVVCNFLYKYFGSYLLKRKSFKNFFYKNIYNKRYEKILKQANLKLLPEEYFISIFIILVLYFILLIILLIVFLFINPKFVQLLFYFGVIFNIFLGISLYNYPLILSKDRSTQIDAGLVYVLPYLKILSKELNLQKIIEIIPDFIVYEEIYKEFTKINYYYKFLGYDVHSSIKLAMETCPSNNLSYLLNDLVAISNSGGNIYNYLETRLDSMNKEIIALERKNIDTLLILSQVYVVLLLISPLFFAIMSAILELVQIGYTSNFNAIRTIFMMVYFLPFGYVIFMLIIYYSKPLYKRISPFKKIKNEI